MRGWASALFLVALWLPVAASAKAEAAAGRCGMATMPSSTASASDSKAAFEIEKLCLEAEKLRKEDSELLGSPWAAFFGGLFATLVAAGVAWRTAYHSRIGTFDVEAQKKRLEYFAAAVRAMEPLALHFPVHKLHPVHCGLMGRELRSWYFSGAGLLISDESRDWCFRLMEALAVAANAKSLRVPAPEEFGGVIGVDQIDAYREKLGHWSYYGTFDIELKPASAGSEGGFSANLDQSLGDKPSAAKPGGDRKAEPHDRFRDFIYLQFLSSRFRTALAVDIAGRRRPHQ